MNTVIITFDGAQGSGKTRFVEAIANNINAILPAGMEVKKITVYEEPYPKLVIDWETA